jgi:hypothetical protein
LKKRKIFRPQHFIASLEALNMQETTITTEEGVQLKCFGCQEIDYLSDVLGFKRNSLGSNMLGNTSFHEGNTSGLFYEFPFVGIIQPVVLA